MSPALAVPLFLTAVVVTAFGIVHAVQALARRRTRHARTTAWAAEHRILRDAYVIVVAEQARIRAEDTMPGLDMQDGDRWDG